MMNTIGKGLVLLNFGLSGLFLAIAVAVFTQTVDWGWMDPRVQTKGVRIASEVDKRTAAAKQAAQVRDQASAQVKNATAGVLLLEHRLPANHLWYMAELKKLRSGDGKIDVKPLFRDKSGLVLDPGELGRVKLGTAIDLDKSYESYQGDSKKLQDDINATLDDIKKLVEQQEQVTTLLNGVTEGGKLTKPGLYALLEMEHQTQTRVKKETEEVRPRWAIELVEAQLLSERMGRLQARLRELDAALPRARK